MDEKDWLIESLEQRIKTLEEALEEKNCKHEWTLVEIEKEEPYCKYEMLPDHTIVGRHITPYTEVYVCLKCRATKFIRKP